MDLASVVAALASVGVRVSGSAPKSSFQVDSSRACPPGLAGPEPSGTINDLGQHFHGEISSTDLPFKFRQRNVLDLHVAALLIGDTIFRFGLIERASTTLSACRGV